MSHSSRDWGANPSSVGAIFSRVIKPSGDLSRPLAKYLLSLDLADIDREKVQTLLAKNESGRLLPAEQEELENLNRVADLLSLWHSQARQTLNASGMRP